MHTCLCPVILIFSLVVFNIVYACPTEMIEVESICIDKHEVTNAEYQKNTDQKPYVGATGYARPNQPRVWLNWYEAKAYCEKAGKRLPTEKEWMRMTDKAITDCSKLSKIEVVYANDRPADVCSKKANKLGFCDSIGNVWEWVNDSEPNGDGKVLMGGGCQSCLGDDIFDIRMVRPPNSRGIYGVRCVRAN